MDRVRRTQLTLSTPSLGITDDAENFGAYKLPHHAFNSLSRDHNIKIEAIIRRIVGNFQLPLSGSPSPIPGFSGSPRLSAAALLRTSVFSGHYLKI